MINAAVCGPDDETRSYQVVSYRQAPVAGTPERERRLRAEVAFWRGDGLPPLVYGPCRKCNVNYIIAEDTIVTTKFVPARRWPWPRCARMRRECRHCGAVWHEQTHDATTAIAQEASRGR